MATKKTDLKNKGRTDNFIPYDPNTDDERSSASSYLPPPPKPPTPTPPVEASYEAERQIESAPYRPDIQVSSDTFDQPPSFTPSEQLDAPVETYSPDTADQPPSLNVRQFEYAKQARGDQPPSLSITPPARPSISFDNTSEPTEADIQDLNKASEQYKEIADETNKKVEEVNKLIEEQNFRANDLNSLAEEINKEIGVAPFDADLLQDREAEIIARQTDLEDRIKKFELNPFGQTDEQGYFVDYDRMFDEQDKINEDIDLLSADFDEYNMWANSAEQPDVTMLTDSYERKLADLNRLENTIFQKNQGLESDIKFTDDLYTKIAERETELQGLDTDLKAQVITNKRILFNAPQIDPLVASERSTEALDLVYSPLSQRGTEFKYDPTAEQGKKIQEVIKPEIFQRTDFDLETPNIEYNFQTPDPLTETQDTIFEPDTFFSRNPIEITTGDLAKSLPFPMGAVLSNKQFQDAVNKAEDNTIKWLSENLGTIETGGVIQEGIYQTTKVGNNIIYTTRRLIRGENDYNALIRDLKTARDQAEAVNALGDWSESAFSPQVGTVVEFLDVPYYYNQLKKLDDIRIAKFDGNPNTSVTDVDDYILALTTLGGLTLKDRGIGLGYSDELKTSGRLLTKYIGQSPETYKKLDFWLSSPLADLPKYDPLDSLRRSDEFIERLPFMDVLVPREETAKILRKFEDDEGNPPEDFTWGIKQTDNFPFFEVDEEAIKSERYKELLPYLQARAEDDYIRPLDLAFTATEVALAYPSIKFAGKLATGTLKTALKTGAYVGAKGASAIGKARKNMPEDIDFLRNAREADLSPQGIVLKNLVKIDDALNNFDDGLKPLEKFQIQALNNPSWLNKKIIPPDIAEMSANRLHQDHTKLMELIRRNSVDGQLRRLRSESPLTQDEIKIKDQQISYLEKLKDQKIDEGYLNDLESGDFERGLLSKIKANGETFKDKIIADQIVKAGYAGTDYHPKYVDLKVESFNMPIGSMALKPSGYKPNQPRANLELAEKNFNEIFDGFAQDKNYKETEFLFNNEYKLLNKAEPKGETAEILGLETFLKKWENSRKGADNFEDLIISWRTRRKQNEPKVNSNYDTLLKSKKISPKTAQKIGMSSYPARLDKPKVTKAPRKTNNDKNIEALIGENIILPKSFKDAEFYKVSDGEKLEESLGKSKDNNKGSNQPNKKPPIDEDINKKFPPTEPPKKEPDDPTKAKKEPDAKRKKEPDTKRKKEPDAKRVKDPEAKKAKDGETKKRKDADTQKRKKAKEGETVKKKKVKKRKKIKDPDTKKRKRRRLKDRDITVSSGGAGDQDTTIKKQTRLFPALVQWKDGDNYVTYDLNTNKKTVRDYALTGGVKGAGNTPESTLKIIRKSSKRPKGFNRRIGNLSLQIKSPEVVTVKKLEKNLYNKNKEFVFKS